MAKGILIAYYAYEELYTIYDVNKGVVVKKREIIFFENIMRYPFIDGFDLALRYNILVEPILEIEHILQILGKENNYDTTDILLMGDLKLSVEDILAITIANFYESTYSTEEYIYVPVDTMVSTISMSFVYHAPKELQQKRKRQSRDKVADSELKVEELIKRYKL